MDDGQHADLDFISSREVTAFCSALGFEETWSGRTIEEIARAGDFKPPVIVASEATAILEALTGLVVMAHLSEDTLYYARLWVMESEGEIAAQIAKGKKADEIAKVVKENAVARLYLGKRLLEKAEREGTNLPR